MTDDREMKVPWLHRRAVRKAAVRLARHLSATGNDGHVFMIGDDRDDIRITVEWVRKDGKDCEEDEEQTQ